MASVITSRGPLCLRTGTGVAPADARFLASSSFLSSSNLPVANPSSLLSRTANTLLPPLPLYRRLLRAHRYILPSEMRSLGDPYVKDEFRRHKAVTNPLQIVGFLGQWKVYLDYLEAEGAQVKGSKERAKFEGRRLKQEEFSKLSDEQLYQLHELMTATNQLYNPSAPGPPAAPMPQQDVDTTFASTSPLSTGDPNAGGTTAGRSSENGDGGQGRKVIQDILDSSAPGESGSKGQ